MKKRKENIKKILSLWPMITFLTQKPHQPLSVFLFCFPNSKNVENVSDPSVLFLEVTSGNLIPVSSIFVLLIVNSVKKNEQIADVNQLPFTI